MQLTWRASKCRRWSSMTTTYRAGQAVHRAVRPGRWARGTPLSEDAIAVLRAYGWPGNIHRAEECIHRAALLAHGSRIRGRSLTRTDGSPLAALVSLPTAESRIEVDGLISPHRRSGARSDPGARWSAATATTPPPQASCRHLRCARCATNCGRSSRGGIAVPPPREPTHPL